MKSGYVHAVRALRAVLRAVGILGVLDAWASRSRLGAWVRSLLSIYDVEELVALDAPWWTMRSAALVEAHLAARPGARVFEWGSGASTAWLARRAGTVVAVEHDPAWAEIVRPLVGDGARVRVVVPESAPPGGGTRSARPGHEGLDFTAYVRSIRDEPGEFDLVVIDGRAREACLREALPRLAEDGLVVFDNVDRARYRAAIAEHPGLEVLTTRGLTPALPYPTRTALLRRSMSR